jgi:histone H4
MASRRPQQFGGPSRFGGLSQRPGQARPQATGSTASASPLASRGLGLGKGAGGLGNGKGVGKGGLKRHMSVLEPTNPGARLTRYRKIRRDTIYGVTKGDIR